MEQIRKIIIDLNEIRFNNYINKGKAFFAWSDFINSLKVRNAFLKLKTDSPNSFF